jgi:hypothetical protein
MLALKYGPSPSGTRCASSQGSLGKLIEDFSADGTQVFSNT